MIDGEPCRLPDWLSCFPAKLECYAADEYFPGGWATLTEIHRQGVFPSERLWTIGSVLFKADTMLRGSGLRGIRFLEEQGFEIRAVREVCFSGARVEQFWRYSLGRLSRERVELLKALQKLSPSLYVLVESADQGTRLPCSLRLTELKGQVDVARRHAGNLRYAMGDPQSAFFNFVHTADEPADLIRELGLLFDAAERREMLLQTMSGSRPDVEGVYERLRLSCVPSDLDFSAAVARLRDQIVSVSQGSDEVRAELLDAAGTLQQGNYHSWLRLRDKLSARRVPIDEIDAMVIAAGLIALKQEHPKQLFPSCEARHWDHHYPALKGHLLDPGAGAAVGSCADAVP